ncbi:MarR family winged helix-turn-helix transcriptional regulator [Ilyobacter polytropus]|uniref:Transcriptional regulator, MarR family n=1 Tax=Ilyobacter polytropus (strain ATCC 51220 / DSM 2926 / LMG 16218 / CuHBu1) TaxID=572544 RepID=E3H6R9_ILYPC|nr:MarR family transcriptional regulator [Ilyobacter polytropus]ADO82438.1 transcriptional regulator, MarR family [Ilyobacter polytropus DSM 2926]
MVKIRTDIVIGLVANIREKSAQFINGELKRLGVEGINSSHGTILSALYDNDGQMTMNEIAKYIARRKSSVTDMVKKLEKLGYVERKQDELDARVINVTLSPKGIEFRKTFLKISKALLEKAYDGFEEEEKEILVKYLGKVRKNFQDI